MKSLLIILFILILAFYFIPFGLYFKAKLDGVKISLWKLFVYRRKKLPIAILINWNAKLLSCQCHIEFEVIVNKYLEGLDMDNIVDGLVIAKKNNLPITFNQACDADKQNIDITGSVKNKASHVDKEKQ